VLRASEERNQVLATRHIDFCNQTYYNPVRFTPIAVNIETKIAGEGYESAQSQMAVWVFAQFAKLRRMFGQVPPFLPLLLVQGDEWSFLAASQSPTVGFDDKRDYDTYIWDKVAIGSTSSLAGVWKVCAVLQYLANWAVTDYAVWLSARLGLQTPNPRPAAAVGTKVRNFHSPYPSFVVKVYHHCFARSTASL